MTSGKAGVVQTEVMLAAVSSDGKALEFAGDELRADRGVRGEALVDRLRAQTANCQTDWSDHQKEESNTN